MTTHRRDFTVAPTPQREVSFTLEGVEFACLPDITMSAMEEYRRGQVPDPSDSTKVGIPLEVCVRFISDALVDDGARELFRKVCLPLPLDAGAVTLHAIREYLIECYAEVGPTTEPSRSLAGPPVSGPTLTDDSGSPAEILTPSPYVAT